MLFKDSSAIFGLHAVPPWPRGLPSYAYPLYSPNLVR